MIFVGIDYEFVRKDVFSIKVKGVFIVVIDENGRFLV